MSTVNNSPPNMSSQVPFQPHPNDFVILMMGPTGTGKTNFINKLTGNAEHQKAGGLKSDTQNVTPYPISCYGLRVVLVDTPGFDDTHRGDPETLEVIANWLIQKYPHGDTLKIAGILYFHRIIDNSMSRSALRNLQIFGLLCGDIFLHRTRLVTTMWDRAKDQDVVVRRENQLKSKFWKKLIAGGALDRRFHNSTSSAQNIVDDLLSCGNGCKQLLLQEELVGLQKRLNETKAAKFIYDQLKKDLAEQRKTLKDLAREAKSQDNPALVKGLQERRDKTSAQLQKKIKEVKKMEIPVHRRVTLWWSRDKSDAKAVELHPED